MRLKVVGQRVWIGIGIIVLLVLVGGLAWGLQGGGLPHALLSRVRGFFSMCKAVLESPAEATDGDFSNAIFLHHSTGRNLIQQGGVREQLTTAGFQFWDHDYNRDGLTRPDGQRAGYGYNIPDDNTNPDGFARIFSQRLHSRPLNAFSGLMRHDVIIFKSCFPVSQITSDAQLEQYKTYYLGMLDVMDQHPDHIFIAVTPPPLNPAATDAETAARARAFADWLTSDDFLGGHPNVLTFDFFDLLAERDPSAPDYNMLRAAYRDGEDSHPNLLANRTIGPLLADFVIGAVQMYPAELAE